MHKKTFSGNLLLAVCFVGTIGLFGCVPEQNGSGDTELLSGEKLYQRHCKQCHAMEPPPKIAPPIKGLAIHYREAFSDKEAAVEHMVAFMQKPDAALSKCRPEAVERFGLMPAMNIAEEKLRKVSEWVWDQYDPELKKRHEKKHGH